MTAVAERPTITIYWTPARTMGLDREPVNAYGVELDQSNYKLIEHVNAVVYPTGYWKITEWDAHGGGEGMIIAGGQEDRQAMAIRRVEEHLKLLWRIK